MLVAARGGVALLGTGVLGTRGSRMAAQVRIAALPCWRRGPSLSGRRGRIGKSLNRRGVRPCGSDAWGGVASLAAAHRTNKQQIAVTWIFSSRPAGRAGVR